MKAIITGASGLLGSACIDRFTLNGVDVSVMSHQQAWDAAQSLYGNAFADADFVVHAAANTNVEQCEIEPDNCYRDNYLLTDSVAAACSLADVQLVYISSTGVYGESQQTPYSEYIEPHPTTHHHRAKLLGEYSVLSASQRNLVLRIGWLFGGVYDNPKNFVARRLDEASKAVKQGLSLFSNSEQWGSPTFSEDVVDRLLLLVQRRCRGIYNVVCEGQASRYEYVKAIVDMAGIDVIVTPMNASSFNRIAKVSSNEMAVNWRSKTEGMPIMPDWRQSLQKYIKHLL